MIITFENNVNQKFSTTIKEIDYSFEVSYNSLYEFWSLNIITDGFSVSGITLVSGINIFRAFPELPFSGICNNIDDPTRDNLNLYRLEVL